MIFNSKLTKEEQDKAIEDLKQIHKIRGKILHMSSIVEYTMSLIITKELHEKYLDHPKVTQKIFDKLKLKDKVKIFVLECKEQKIPAINEFEESMNKVLSYRDAWAHGWVYYHSFEADQEEGIKKPINFIFYPHFKGIIGKPIHFKTDYFKIANKEFPFVINWLEENGFFKEIEKIPIIWEN